MCRQKINLFVNEVGRNVKQAERKIDKEGGKQTSKQTET